MRQVTWCFAAFLLYAAVTSFVDAQEYYVVPQVAIDPVQQQPAQVVQEAAESEQDRHKRKLLEPVVEATFGVKHNILHLIFGKVNQLIDYKTHLVKQLDKKNLAINKKYGLYVSKPCEHSTTVKPGPTTTEDVAEFDSKRVALDIPGEVFGSSFTLITEISKIVNDVIINTADRTQKLVEAVKPMLGRVFGIKLSTRRPAANLFRKTSASGSRSSSRSSSNSTRASRSSVQETNSLETNTISS